MSRPFFFTGRRQIKRRDAQFWVREAPVTRQVSFEARISLQRYRLPPDAVIIVEAYNEAYIQRFNYGTVESPAVDQRHILSELPPGDVPLFRVKVIDNTGDIGLMLAAVERIRPREPESEQQGRHTILPVRWKSRHDMGHEAWKVHFVDSGSTPELWMNEDWPRLREKTRTHAPDVEGLIYPAVLRIILTRKLREDVSDGEEPELDPQWTRFVGEFYSESLRDQGDDIENWIESVVDAFASKQRYLDRMREFLSEADNE